MSDYLRTAADPRIAVIVVCRNALPALRETVASLRTLNDPRVLPIIIDGASTDGTPAYVAGLSGWAHYTSSEPDGGIYDAMNKGWRAAPDDAYVLYLGAGDRLLELPSSAELRDPEGKPQPLVLGRCDVGSMPFVSRWGREMQLRNTAHHQAMMLLKRLSPEAPFDTTLRIYADWDFNLRLLRRGVRAHHAAGLRSYALPGGASWSMEIDEISAVARRHGGVFIGIAARLLNTVSRWRRRWRSRGQ